MSEESILIEVKVGIPTMDIEAVSWITPIAVGFFDGIKYNEFIRENEEEDIIWKFLSFVRDNFQGYSIYAHCAAKYDNKLILQSLHAHGEKVELIAGLAKLHWLPYDISFEDSYLLIPFTLKRANALFGSEEKGEWAHNRNLAPWEMGEELSTFREYLRKDCITLSTSLGKLCEILGENFSITPSISLASTTVKAFNKNFHKVDSINDNERYEDFIRLATYGGRNEVYIRYGENINLYDVKSMYVSCYDIPVPVGGMFWTTSNLDKGVLTEARVKVPKDKFIGPLPLRSLSGRLVFPVGEFKGWWDTRELRNAIKQGVDVTVLRQLGCEEKPILLAFGEYMRILRRDKSEYDELWKMLGLALSGKFGQSRWRDTVKTAADVTGFDFTGWTPLDKEEFYFTCKEYQKRLPYIKPAISMRIRAEARIRHLDLLLDAQTRGKLYYGDTDSVYCETEMPTGDDIGQLNYLGKAERGYFLRQKFYATIMKGKLIQRSSGFSDLKLSEDDFKELLEGKEILQIGGVDLSTLKHILKDNEIAVLYRRRMVKGTESDNRTVVGKETEPIIL